MAASEEISEDFIEISKAEREVEMLKKYDKAEHPSGESLPMKLRIDRVKLLIAFIKAGIPPKKTW